MAIFQDFSIDPNSNDLLISNGDFVVLPSDNQHIADIITSFAGSFKQFPQLGVGLLQYLKSQNGGVAGQQVIQQLQSDGYQVSSANVLNTNGNLTVNFPNGITRNS